jgi:hypothetical protein
MGEFRHIDIPKFRDADISIRRRTEGRNGERGKGGLTSPNQLTPWK